MIQERTGIKQRRWAVKGDGDTTFSMGLKAENAIKNAGIEKQDIDFIVFATLSPDYYFPGPGVQVQEALGIDTAGALDVRNQCSGFVYGISVADQFIKTGMYKNILVIGSELQSRGIDVSTEAKYFCDFWRWCWSCCFDSRGRHFYRNFIITFTFSRACVRIGRRSTRHGKRWVTEIIEDNDPEDMSYIPYERAVCIKNAIRRFSEVINQGLEANDLQVSDIDIQYSIRPICEFLNTFKKVSTSDDQVFNNIQHNTTAASIPIALSEAVSKVKLNQAIRCPCGVWWFYMG